MRQRVGCASSSPAQVVRRIWPESWRTYVAPGFGVPIQSKLQGLDSLLSTAQMPGGIPVGTLAIGEAGAKNAALLAGAILATSDEAIRKKLETFRKKQSESVLAAKLPT